MKEDFRRELMKIRKSLSKNEIGDNSYRIKESLFALKEFEQGETILFYVSYDNEVYTHEMIKESMALGKNVIVPVSDKKYRKLILSKLENWDDLKLGSYGILEPVGNKIKEISLEENDLIIVPGVGFDERGNRIGHGKGYYDDLLSKSKAPHIGLAFESQIVKEIPTEEHDMPVDKIITEKRVIDCKQSR